MNAALSCRAFAVALAALWPFAQAHAQSSPVTPSPSPPAKSPFETPLDIAPRSATDTVTLSLEKADLPELVRTMSQMTGKQFVLAAAPRSFEATLISQQKVTVAEAYQAFLSILAANHLTVVPSGRYFKIVDAQDSVRQAPIHSAREGAPADERYVTYLHRVAHVSADEVAQAVLSKIASHDGAVIPYGNLLLLTDTGANVRRMLRVLEEIDVAQAEDRVWLEPLQYTPSADAKRELDDLLDTKGGGQKETKGNRDGRVTKMVSLDRPNALLIVGSQAGYERVLELIRAIDVPTPSEGQMHVVMLEHTDAKKIVGAINEAVSAASGASGGSGKSLGVFDGPAKISAEEMNNALIVTAGAHDFAAIREVIRRLDQPRRQVYIEAVVMDLSIQRSNEIDSAFHGFDDLSGVLGSGAVAYGGSNPLRSLLVPTDSSALQALVLGVRGPSIAVPSFLQSALGTSSIPGLGFFLDAFALANDADILSTPHILATDNVPADIKVQLNTSLQRNAPSFGLPTTSSSAASALSSLATLAAPASVNYAKIGPEIKVTPHLNDSDEVRLDIHETISDLTADPPQGTLGTINYVERAAETTLTVKDGHTVVIGGLVRDKLTHTATKVPLFGDIPVLGLLFRSSKETVEKDNLVLILTPHIIRDEEDMRRIFEQRMQERQEFIDHYFVFRDESPPDFDPGHGRGLLAALRASYRDVEARRLLEDPAPLGSGPAHMPRPALDLPSSQLPSPQAAPSPSVNETSAPRAIERMEK